MEARLRGIQTACAGRDFAIGTSGLTPILDTHAAFYRQVNTWTEVVKKVLGNIPQS
jgi:hypothetical protein